MVDPRQRQERLRRDFAAMQRLRCAAIDFETDGMNPPERYTVRFRLRSLLGVDGGKPIYTANDHVHEIEIRLPASYPERLANDDVTFVTAPVFHPNVFADGRVCLREFYAGESLDRLVLRLARFIQCDLEFAGIDHAANFDANTFFKAHPELFPTDRTPLPLFVDDHPVPRVPERKRFGVARSEDAPAKRFVASTAPGSRHRFVATENSSVWSRG